VRIHKVEPNLMCHAWHLCWTILSYQSTANVSLNRRT
jgi:hypothetical protein